MIELTKLAMSDESKFSVLENIYWLYDQLQYCENLIEMADILAGWLSDTYNVVDFKFTLYNMEYNSTELITQKGQDFDLNHELVSFFIINTHTPNNAVVSFIAKDQEQFDSINEDFDLIESAFFMISPMLQNGILKKQHIDSSSIDSVTNVYNRQFLLEHIDKVLSLSQNTSNSITFLMIGIDRFKAIIDEFDYEAGDLVLIELARIIHAQIKDYDIVARLTGDEFLIALSNVSTVNDGEHIAKEIIDKFAKSEILVNKETKQTLKKTVCVGISSYPQDGHTIDEVIKNADSFLVEAKNKGRGKISIFNSEDLNTIDLF